MIEFLITPLLAVALLALMSGPLGCFVVWKKMAYFGDTLAHASLLGVALGLFLQVNHYLSVVAVCLIIALLISYYNSSNISLDTSLGILAHASLASGLIFISLQSNQRINMLDILMGDVLTINSQDLILLFISACIVLSFVYKLWQKFVLISIDEELARVEGLAPKPIRFVLTALIALTIALGMTLVGALLISAFLIIPAATARYLSSSPEAMAMLACLFGIVSSAAGLISSAYIDAPAGPAIILCSLVLFILALGLEKLKAHSKRQ